MINAIVLNDTTRNIGHFGCLAVMKNIEFLCYKNNIKIIKKFKKTNLKKDKNYIDAIDSSDIIIINGEGTMHHDQKEACEVIESALLARLKGKKIFIINTIWQENALLNSYLWIFDKIFVRDGLSGSQIEKAGYKCSVIADLSLYKGDGYFIENAGSNNSQVVTDSVHWHVTKILAEFSVLSNMKFCILDAKLISNIRIIKLLMILRFNLMKMKVANEYDIRDSAFVVTGRYHALCMCIKYQVPFLCVTSNSHKVEGVFFDLQIPFEDFVINENEVDINCLIEKSRKIIENNKKYRKIFDKYLSDAQVAIENMFFDIAADSWK